MLACDKENAFLLRNATLKCARIPSVRDVSARVPPLNFEHFLKICARVPSMSVSWAGNAFLFADRKHQVRDVWTCQEEDKGWAGSMMVLENVDVTTRARRVHFDFSAFAGDGVCVTRRLKEKNRFIHSLVKKVRPGVFWRKNEFGHTGCPHEFSGRDSVCLEGYW